jgi:hypothetical protein
MLGNRWMWLYGYHQVAPAAWIGEDLGPGIVGSAERNQAGGEKVQRHKGGFWEEQRGSEGSQRAAGICPALTGISVLLSCPHSVST